MWYYLGGDRGKAEQYFQRCIRADPLFADAYVRLAQLYRMKGDTKKYEASMQKALAIDPQNSLALDAKTRACRFIPPSQETKAVVEHE